MMKDTFGYADLDGRQIAYRISGGGSRDLVYAAGAISHIDVALEEPTFAQFVQRLGHMGRLIRFDRRGIGASDALPPGLSGSWETWVEDLRAAMDAVGSERAVIIGVHDAGPMAMLFAATYPDRVAALVLANTTARFLAADDYPTGFPPEMAGQLVEGLSSTWGTAAALDLAIPSRADNDRFREWYAKFQRAAATPRVAAANFAEVLNLDVRHVLSSIRVPTLVLHRSDLALIPSIHGRCIAERIPGARFVEIPGRDIVLYPEALDEILHHIQQLMDEGQPETDAERRLAERSLASVLFTDIVSSTEVAASMGDRRWRDLLDLHDEVVARTVERYHGRLIKRTGDGTLAVFDGPSAAILCASSIGASLRDLGLQLRAGIHCGEIELRGSDVGGVAVHIASRIADFAEPGELLVSRTVRDLVAGSTFDFVDRGPRELKGLSEAWSLFAVRATPEAA